MAERSFKLKLISANGLTKLTRVRKMDVYAVAYISGGTVNQDQKQRTFVDRGGDSNPTWNSSMKFTIDEYAALKNRATLVVKIIMESTLGDKTVGEVHVPIKQLLESYSPGGKSLRSVSYQVTKPSGKLKGELSFSYKFGASKLEKPVKADDGKYSKLHEPVLGYRSPSLYPPVYEASVDATPEFYQPPPGYDGYPPKQSGYGGNYPQPPPVYNGYPPQQSGCGGYTQQPSVYDRYPPQQTGFGGYPQQPSVYDRYPPQQTGYGGNNPQQPSMYDRYPPQQSGYGVNYPQQPSVYDRYPPQQSGYGGNYPQPPLVYDGYPPQHSSCGGYPQQPSVYDGYPPQQSGYGGNYPQPPLVYDGYPSQQSGYRGHPQPPVQPKNKFGLGLGAWLLAVVGGLVLGEIMSNVAACGGCNDGC